MQSPGELWTCVSWVSCGSWWANLWSHVHMCGNLCMLPLLWLISRKIETNREVVLAPEILKLSCALIIFKLKDSRWCWSSIYFINIKWINLGQEQILCLNEQEKNSILYPIDLIYLEKGLLWLKAVPVIVPLLLRDIVLLGTSYRASCRLNGHTIVSSALVCGTLSSTFKMFGKVDVHFTCTT